MRGQGSSRLPAGPDPLPHAGEGTARCGFADLHFTSTTERSAPSPAGGRRRGMRVPASSRLPAGPHPGPLPHAGEGTARCWFADLRFTSTPARSAPSPAGGRRRGMRVPASSRLPAGPHPDPLPHTGEGTAQCGFTDLRFTSTPVQSAPSPAGGRRRGMREPASSCSTCWPSP
ncbi:hypothetical protein NB714_003042 [Pantoea dispersa]|nr:hypothetical protein [Pantoea dispersa]MCW0326917.1 hypothetical protein [Pantoea dispersa]MCW0433211.1 hypothetical protein [Pantoea dispersa]